MYFRAHHNETPLRVMDQQYWLNISCTLEVAGYEFKVIDI